MESPASVDRLLTVSYTTTKELVRLASFAGIVTLVSAAYQMYKIQGDEDAYTEVTATVVACEFSHAGIEAPVVCVENGCGSAMQALCNGCSDGCAVHVSFVYNNKEYVGVKAVTDNVLQVGSKHKGFVRLDENRKDGVEFYFGSKYEFFDGIEGQLLSSATAAVAIIILNRFMQKDDTAVLTPSVKTLLGVVGLASFVRYASSPW